MSALLAIIIGLTTILIVVQIWFEKRMNKKIFAARMQTPMDKEETLRLIIDLERFRCNNINQTPNNHIVIAQLYDTGTILGKFYKQMKNATQRFK